MKNFAEFQVTGRVGKIKPFEGAIRVTVAANYRRQDDQGNWADDPHWNEVVIFRKSTRNYVAEHVQVGDLVFVRGRLRQDSFTDSGGEQHYMTNLIVSDFGLLAKKQPAEGEEA
ncbi:single-stranded DNA-binding protein [Phyllobacterium brassicacearum]|uniref:Single-stranded DNA-binding protein n=1 Tax=Phyllobacterium brassicacearum TaxID=314235 RepID=A0A2P7BUB2_9HYPH|nr:single-stranded DNA-binding protein [Phyllobacterium brassicacearum]PSH70057.1 single-stranded DNA-binding protein [Phyllobacterium brassicacearum]TDQ34084.1 single stranded DNA-binding protein [Phyllobacterium brassicacearum]